LVSPDEGLFESRNLLFSQIVNFEFFKTVDVSSSVPTSSRNLFNRLDRFCMGKFQAQKLIWPVILKDADNH
jgi:hypothetical protein